VSPFYIPALIGNIAAGFLAMEHDFRGPNLSTQTACATGNHPSAWLFFLFKMAWPTLWSAAVSEGTISAICFAGFANMKALSTGFNNHPEKASRPFDKKRDGFPSWAKAPGFFVLEEYESAKKRGAEIFCEVASVGMNFRCLRSRRSSSRR